MATLLVYQRPTDNHDREMVAHLHDFSLSLARIPVVNSDFKNSHRINGPPQFVGKARRRIGDLGLFGGFPHNLPEDVECVHFLEFQRHFHAYMHLKSLILSPILFTEMRLLWFNWVAGGRASIPWHLNI